MTPLHQFGAWLRGLFLAVPMNLAELLFLLVPVLLLWWVLKLPETQVRPVDRPSSRGENLRAWAALALLFQILIYWFL